MPNRILRSDVLKSPKMKRLDRLSKLFVYKLISAVDDFGRFEADTKFLRAALYPDEIDETTDAEITNWLENCEKAGIIKTYFVNDERYVQLLNCKQQIRSKQSKYPSLDDDTQMIRTCVADDEHMHSTCVADAKQTPKNSDKNTAQNQATQGKEDIVHSTCIADATQMIRTCIADATQMHSTCKHLLTLDVDEDVDEDGVSFTKTKNRFCFGNTTPASLTPTQSTDPPKPPNPPNPNNPASPSLAGAICGALKTLGLSDINPLHPELLWLIDQGVPKIAFEKAAILAKAKGKGFAYTLGIVKGQISQAKAQSPTGKALNPFKPNNPHDQHAVVEPI